MIPIGPKKSQEIPSFMLQIPSTISTHFDSGILTMEQLEQLEQLEQDELLFCSNCGTLYQVDKF